MKKEIDPRYIPDNLPKRGNILLYVWRMIRKIFCVSFFSVGSIIIAAIVFPFIRLFNLNNQERFRRAGHHFISLILNFFVYMMKILHISIFKVDDIERLRNLKGCVIVANHPSLLDVVYTLSFVKNADCIVKAELVNSPMGGIVKNLYITNNVDFEKMTEDCIKCLKEGSNLIIFPEGTRSPYKGENAYKKGAARIALAAGANVQPMHIGGNMKYGLGKYEPFWKVHPTDIYRYEFKVLPQIDITKYKDLAPAIAAKRLTEDMRLVIDSEGAKLPSYED